MSDPRQKRIILLTGDGKGKTTSALGMALRAAGHGLRVCVIQFVKQSADTVSHIHATKHAYTANRQPPRPTRRGVLRQRKEITPSAIANP